MTAYMKIVYSDSELETVNFWHYECTVKLQLTDSFCEIWSKRNAPQARKNRVLWLFLRAKHDFSSPIWAKTMCYTTFSIYTTLPPARSS